MDRRRFLVVIAVAASLVAPGPAVAAPREPGGGGPPPPAVVVAALGLGLGDSDSCAVVGDGSVRCWGDNYFYQLGDGTDDDRSAPVPVPGVTGAAAVASGYETTCAVTDGHVLCWGGNGFGLLGDGSPGTVTERATPGPVTGVTTAIAVTIGFYHACATLDDGGSPADGAGIVCWGNNEGGELGDGSDSYGSSVPVAVSGISNAVAVSAGRTQTCALRHDGTVSCWGNGVRTPAAIPGLSDAVGVSVGRFHACAVKAGGTVWCWGGNEYGQLGDSTTTDRASPVQAVGIADATAVAAGDSHTCALRGSHAVVCWGANWNGMLGDGTTTDRHVPGPVAALTSVVAIDAGQYHTCALLGDHGVQCWGSNSDGQIGNGTSGSGAEALTPAAAIGFGPALTVPSAPLHVTATAGDGTATVAWDEPISGGGTEITGYEVLSSPGDLGCVPSPATARTCAVAGLTNGYPYTFRVRAANDVGTGPFSDRSDPVTPLAVQDRPDPPTGVTGAPGDRSVVVSWTAPANPGSSAIIAYAVQGSPGGGTCTPEPATATTCTVSGLTNGQAYTFTVTATNHDWTSDASVVSAPVTPRTVAGAPQDVTAAVHGASVTVTWVAPGSNGGSAIFRYVVHALPGAAACVPAPETALTCTFPTLPDGLYTVAVTAENGAGAGPAGVSAPVRVDTTAPIPAAPSVIPTVGQSLAGTAIPLTVSWSAARETGSGIAAYHLEQKTGLNWATIPLAPTAARSTAVRLGAGSTSRAFRVSATDHAGNVSTPATGPTFTVRLVQETSNTISWTGTWRSKASTSASGGKVRYATSKNAATTFRFTGRAVAWVSTMSRGAGKARVYVDGAFVKTVDLRSAVSHSRRIVYARTWSTVKRHTLKIVCLGTSGRPRIEVDAFVVLK